MESDSKSVIAVLDNAQKAFDATQNVVVSQVQPWSPDLIQFLSSSVLLFSAFALILASVLLWRSDSPAQQVLRVFGVIAILCMSTLLLIVGYANDQLTPIVGLFGAIAGYLLGKDTTNKQQ